jgi:hypothetical protein
MNFVEELRWRGMIHDIMPGTEEMLEKRWPPVILVLILLLILFISDIWYR